MTSEPASPLMRGAAAIGGLVFLGAGVWTCIGSVQAMIALLSQDSAHIFSQRDTLYVAIWLLFALSIAMAGASLINASLRARRHNMVPGPTLYVAGASLMIIALFLLASGAPVFALAAGAVATVLMVAEYSSDQI